MALGVSAGSLSSTLEIPAAVLVTAGVVLSRLWNWRTDPVERSAWGDPAAARLTAWLRWSEIVAGGLFTVGLGALVLDAEWIAVGAGIALTVWIGAMFALDKPPA
jgi:hypothetical protein